MPAQREKTQEGVETACYAADEADHDQPGPGAENVEGLLSREHEGADPSPRADHVGDHHRRDRAGDADLYARRDLRKRRRKDDASEKLAAVEPVDRSRLEVDRI